MQAHMQSAADKNGWQLLLSVAASACRQQSIVYALTVTIKDEQIMVLDQFFFVLLGGSASCGEHEAHHQRDDTAL